MAELITIARPYAVAAFNLAKQRGQLKSWSDMLGYAKSVYENSDMQAVLANPKLNKESIEKLLLAIVGEKLDGAGRNLLILLVQNDRLEALPKIFELYEQLRAEEECVIEAQIASAFDLSQDQLRALVQKLETRTGRQVRAAVALSPELIGGVRVQIGDEVWDASVRGQLESMSAALTR